MTLVPDWWIRRYRETQPIRAAIAEDEIECPHEEKFCRDACRRCYARWWRERNHSAQGGGRHRAAAFAVRLTLATLMLLVGVASAHAQRRPEPQPKDLALLVADNQPPLVTICSIRYDGAYERGPTLRALSCMDFYGRVVASGPMNDGTRLGVYACWALDPCGWPK